MEKQPDIMLTAVLAFAVVLMCSAEQQSMLSESMCMEEDNIILKCVFNRKGDIYFYPTHNEQILRLLVEKLEGFQIDLTNLPKVDFVHVTLGDATWDNLRGLSTEVSLDVSEMSTFLHCSVGINLQGLPGCHLV